MKNILLDILILLAVFLGIFFFSSDPVLNKEFDHLFSLDIGNFLVAIGAFWTVGAFFKIGSTLNSAIS